VQKKSILITISGFNYFQRTDRDGARHLLDLLAKKNNEAFEHFVEALRKPYPWLSQQLQAEVPKTKQVDEESFLDSLLVGGLPQAPKYNVERKEKVMYVLLYFMHVNKMNKDFTEKFSTHGWVYVTVIKACIVSL
jgi:hypothetical protein